MLKLKVIEEAHNLTLNIYKTTNEYPKHELYGLTSQIRRAAASIPTNIMEGKARGSKPDFIRFLFISRGSLEEVKYLLLLSKDLGYITEGDYKIKQGKADRVGMMINGLVKSLRSGQEHLGKLKKESRN